MVMLNVTFLFQMYSVIALSYIATLNVIFIDSYTECHYAGCRIFIVMLNEVFFIVMLSVAFSLSC